MIEDGGSAIFDKNFEQNILLLSDSFKSDFTALIYKKKITNLTAKELNEVKITDSTTNQIIDSSDILRLYIDDSILDDTDDIDISSQKLFHYDNEFKFSNQVNTNIQKFDDIKRDNFLKDYSLMISENKFYIKMPMNLYLNKFHKYALDKKHYNNEFYTQVMFKV